LVSFECGTRTGKNSLANCDNFLGESGAPPGGTEDTEAGVIAMRKVVFKTGFHSSIYADDEILDFVVSFSRGTVDGYDKIH